MTLRPVAIGTLAVLLCACATTSLKQTWKSPDCRQPVGKLAVLAIEPRSLVREGFENRFVHQLTRAGAPAVATFDLLPLDAIKQDKPAAAERFRATGAQALLILRLADKSSSYHEARPGQERWGAVVSGFETTGWYGYYDVGFMDLSPSYGNLKETVYLEASVYDLNTQKPLWSGVTKTVVSETMDRMREMDPLVATFVAAMQKDGVVQ